VAITQSHTDESKRKQVEEKREWREHDKVPSMQDGRGGLNHDYDASERDNRSKKRVEICIQHEWSLGRGREGEAALKRTNTTSSR
jgi:hypothetical protein